MEEKNEYLDIAGKFPAVVTEPQSGWLTTRGAKETPAIRIPLQVSSGPHEGKKAVWFGYLTDASVEFTIRALAKAFGFNGDLEALQKGTTNFSGIECQVVAEFEEWEGEKRLRIKYINPISSGAPALEETTVANIIGNIGSKAKAIAADALGADSSPQATLTPASPPVSTTSSPF